MSTSGANVVIFGCGYAGTAFARLARTRNEPIVAVVRSETHAQTLRATFGGTAEVYATDSQGDPTGGALDPAIARVGPQTHVIVAFPPDGATDAYASPLVAAQRPAAITYVSSTGVYGSLRGVIDDTTPLPSSPDERGARILAAEAAWRESGATVLRCPAIYGADRGVHLRIVRGEFRLTGEGHGFTSRIHVEDLAQLLLAARSTRGQTYVVGDARPATQHDVATWVAREYGVAFPSSIAEADAHETLRGDRRVDGSRALAALGVTLAYPSYETGMARRSA